MIQIALGIVLALLIWQVLKFMFCLAVAIWLAASK